MKFFLDENFPKKASQLLSAEDHEIIDLRGTDNEGITDRKIFELAQKNNAVFLTTDKDFFHTIPFHFSEHCGIVIIALDQPNSERILEKLKWFLKYFDLSDLSNKTVLLKERTYALK